MPTDQPAPCTTAALVDITHHITLMLETNTYVRCILIDYSKAFDTINHKILFAKLRTLITIPQLIIPKNLVLSGGAAVEWVGVELEDGGEAGGRAAISISGSRRSCKIGPDGVCPVSPLLSMSGLSGISLLARQLRVVCLPFPVVQF